jgi:hypothetical protein
MMGIKLNAQVIIKNLQPESTQEKPLPPTGAQRTMELEYQEWARLSVCTQGNGPHTHCGRNDRGRARE